LCSFRFLNLIFDLGCSDTKSFFHETESTILTFCLPYKDVTIGADFLSLLPLYRETQVAVRVCLTKLRKGDSC